MKSWKNMIYWLVAVILACTTLSTAYISVNYYNRLNETYQEGNERIVEIWTDSVEQRLQTVNEHLRSLTLEIFRSGVEIRHGSEAMPYFQQSECAEIMQNELLIGSDAGVYFLRDTESKLLLISASHSDQHTDNTSLQNYLKQAELHATGFFEDVWTLENVGKDVYFMRTMTLGKYIIGVMSRLSRYDLDSAISGADGFAACVILQGDELFWVGSQPQPELFAIQAGELHAAQEDMLISSCPLGNTGTTVNLAVRAFTLKNVMVSALPGIATMGCLCILLVIILIVQLTKTVSRPTEELLQATHEIQKGNQEYRIQAQAGTKEFDTLIQSFNDMIGQIHNLRIEAYDREIQEQRDELAMLRAQIRPHFYLNAITTVSNMTYENRPKDIRKYLAALAKYMRYMLSLQEKFVTVDEELNHIASFVEMQKMKFPDSVNVVVQCEAGTQEVKIPHLILFTVIGNAFKHAMSLYSPLELRIKCQHYQAEGFSGSRILVWDNGNGFSKEVLDMFRPEADMPQAKNHFGLSNVTRTLQLTYHRKDLLFLSNRDDGGAQVEIRIPALAPEKQERAES